MRSAALVLLLAGLGVTADGQSSFRTHNDRFIVSDYATPGAWKQRAAYLREHILASAGLLPMPQRAPLRAQVFDERRHATNSVIVIHNAGGRFTLAGPRIEARKLTSDEIVRLLKSSSFVSGAANNPASVSTAAADR